MVERILDCNDKKTIARRILEALPEWFGIEQAREAYISDSVDQQFFAAMESGQSIGFLCLKETGKDTVEIAVMGVLREFHHQGVGRILFERAKVESVKAGYSFMQVKTVRRGRCREYDGTNEFYIRVGFKKFELLPTLWGERNPCQIYVTFLRS